MATFEEQVEALVGFATTGIAGSGTIPTHAQLSQFLKDGVIDVADKMIKKSPNEITKFLKKSSEQTANDTLDINGAKIATVLREAGVSNDWRECKFIPPSHQKRVEDVNSIFYASKFNPVFTVLENGVINVYPAPDSGGVDGFVVYYVNNVPQDKGGAALIYSHSDIKYFPDDKVYLVVLYATIKVLQAKLTDLTLVEEDPELVQALTQSLALHMQQYMQEFQSEQQAQPTGGR